VGSSAGCNDGFPVGLGDDVGTSIFDGKDEGRLLGIWLGSIEGTTECKTVGVLLGTRLCRLEGKVLDCCECTKVGASLGNLFSLKEGDCVEILLGSVLHLIAIADG